MPAQVMSKTRLAFGEVAWDLIWRDRIRAEEREGRVRIPLEQITGQPPAQPAPPPPKRAPKASEVKYPRGYELVGAQTGAGWREQEAARTAAAAAHARAPVRVPRLPAVYE